MQEKSWNDSRGFFQGNRCSISESDDRNMIDSTFNKLLISFYIRAANLLKLKKKIIRGSLKIFQIRLNGTS